MCVGLDLVLMLTNFRCPRTQTFCLASFLVKKKDRLLIVVDDKPWKRKVDPSKYYHCNRPGNCSALKILMCVGLALLLMLTNFRCPRTKSFCLASFLVNKKQ
jgi:hypothetical protein